MFSVGRSWREQLIPYCAGTWVSVMSNILLDQWSTLAVPGVNQALVAIAPTAGVMHRMIRLAFCLDAMPQAGVLGGLFSIGGTGPFSHDAIARVIRRHRRV